MFCSRTATKSPTAFLNTKGRGRSTSICFREVKTTASPGIIWQGVLASDIPTARKTPASHVWLTAGWFGSIKASKQIRKGKAPKPTHTALLLLRKLSVSSALYEPAYQAGFIDQAPHISDPLFTKTQSKAWLKSCVPAAWLEQGGM